MNTTELFDLGQLAEAAYGNFVDASGLISDSGRVQQILQGHSPDGGDDPYNSLNFSVTQARMFTEQLNNQSFRYIGIADFLAALISCLSNVARGNPVRIASSR